LERFGGLGLPFLRNMLAGDLLFTLGFFAFYTYAERIPAWQRIDNRIAIWLLEFKEQH